jgi:hypothetical protein
MMARWFYALAACVSLAGAGCCCMPNSCGPAGNDLACGCFCLPKPIVWCGDCNECGPHGESCADPCGECGIIPALIRSRTCGKGCGEIYWGEWYSDPPDCCDPCDDCGNWVGPQGHCNLGPLQRLLAAFHGYRYCPPPDCGPVCGPLCNRGGCATCGSCGGAGCDTCGGGIAQAPHGADIYYEGPNMPHVAPHSILEENWNIPKAPPVPGKPIHKAQQPPQGQMTRAAVGTGVRQVNHQR